MTSQLLRAKSLILLPLFFPGGFETFGEDKIESSNSLQFKSAEIHAELPSAGLPLTGKLKAVLQSGLEKDSAESVFTTWGRTFESARKSPWLTDVAYESLDLGESLEAKGHSDLALEVYRALPRREELLWGHREGLKRLKVLALTGVGSGSDVAVVESSLKRLEKDAHFDAVLFHRLGRTFAFLGRNAEARLAFAEVLQRQAGYPRYDEVLRSLAELEVDDGNYEAAREVVWRLLKDFPKSPASEALAELPGGLWMREGRLPEAEEAYGKAYEIREGQANQARLLFLRGMVRFEIGRYESARQDFELCLQRFPTAGFAEECAYKIALTYYYGNEVPRARELLEEYLRQQPVKGAFTVDARYRLNQLRFARAEAEEDAVAREKILGEVWADLNEVTKSHPDSSALGQAHLLKAQSARILGKKDEALDSFRDAIRAANNDQVLKSAMEEAVAMLEAAKRWEDVAALQELAMGAHPRHRFASVFAKKLIAVRNRLEAQDQAVQFLADFLHPHLDNPRADQVDLLITSLASFPGNLYPSGDVAKALVSEGTSLSPTAYARVLWARAEFARQQKNEERSLLLVRLIAQNCPPETLSPLLLARVGELHRVEGRPELAESYFEELVVSHADSSLLDHGLVGLGQLAYARDSWEEALRSFNLAIARIPDGGRILEAQLGAARSLFKLRRFGEADQVCETIIKNKEWRGESTAESLFLMAESAFAREDWPRAHVLYQRVYVGWQKHPSWVGKAYLRAADVLSKLGKTDEVKATLRDLLRQPKLVNLPEGAEARRRLALLAPPPPVEK